MAAVASSVRIRIILLGLVSGMLATCKPPSKEERVADTLLNVTTHTVSDNVLKLGEEVFTKHCANCHKDVVESVAPSLEILSQMTSRAIFSAVTKGRMIVQAKDLSEKQREAVAQWITKMPLKESSFPYTAYTKFNLTQGDRQAIFNTSGWGGDLEATGYRTAEQAGIRTQNVSSLKLKWAFGFPEGTQVRSKPALIGNWLLVGSQYGDVYALHKETGLIGWMFRADAAIRGAISYVIEKEVTAYFADYATNVYAVDVTTGKLKWKKRTGIHPQSSVTGSVVVYDGVVYVPLSSFEVVLAANRDFVMLQIIGWNCGA